MASDVFATTPIIGRTEIVVLQVMTFGDNEMLIEYVEKQYWEE
jgi:hypothetical protein